ncbi:hypothetical protein [Kamptonema sp. UHCC 0994]|uniref:hypothetical protein n=1 Tax=Kamptonema sp. UHCC 0994 TaxID=3031329 RepID=UPI0023B96BBE|nr:hypothetical protein [Kamptonema sp. UHCC 0994]MDF0551640.1 hypothetical protein [Kamptonema sp. UHCC 0994]
MEPLFDSPKKILDFLTLLQTEQAKENSDLLDATTWQDLTQLDRALDDVNTPDKIAKEILRWCNKYPKIKDALNTSNWQKLRCDMVDEDHPDIPSAPPDNEADIIRNRDKIQKIIRDNENNNSQNNPEN